MRIFPCYIEYGQEVQIEFVCLQRQRIKTNAQRLSLENLISVENRVKLYGISIVWRRGGLYSIDGATFMRKFHTIIHNNVTRLFNRVDSSRILLQYELRLRRAVN